jgi:phosphonopyruvate decarboxylase
MGSIAAAGVKKPKNLCHIVLNNGSHDSVGGQPTIAPFINLPKIAHACGYVNIFHVKSKEELKTILAKEYNDLTFIEVKVKKGSRKDLSRPKTSPVENKMTFTKYIRSIQ